MTCDFVLGREGSLVRVILATPMGHYLSRGLPVSRLWHEIGEFMAPWLVDLTWWPLRGKAQRSDAGITGQRLSMQGKGYVWQSNITQHGWWFGVRSLGLWTCTSNMMKIATLSVKTKATKADNTAKRFKRKIWWGGLQSAVQILVYDEPAVCTFSGCSQNSCSTTRHMWHS